MSYLTASGILDSDDRKTRDVDVPEWNGEVILRELSGEDLDKWQAHIANGKFDGTVNLQGMRSLMVGLSLVDESGKRLLSDDAIERKFVKKSGAVINRLYMECMSLNSISEDEQEALEENFIVDQSEPSTTD